MRKWHVAAVVCGFASLLLLLTSLGSTHWLESNIVNLGLWKVCIDTSVHIVCLEFGMDVKVYVHITRALLILGASVGFVACTLLSLLFFRSESGCYSIARTAAKASHVAGAFALIAMSTFTRNTWGSHSDEIFHVVSYGWSVFLGWACGLLFFITGGLSHIVSTYGQSSAGREVEQPLQGNTPSCSEIV